MRSKGTSSCFRRSRNRRGVACVEFAVIALPLIVLILGTVDVGQAVTSAAREGCRMASHHAPTTTPTSETDVRAVVLDYLEQCYPRVARADLAAGLTVKYTLAPALDDPNDRLVTVQVDFAFNTVRWLKGPGLARSKVFSSKTIMRKE
ncbi:MAG: pilus assembly protein [Planctomycetia bacterium]|nr:pilus assembly protein [Planctomycetia bacterium]